MYCHECGTGNTVDSKYCKECGTKINDGYRTMMLSVQDLPTDQSDETLDSLARLLDMAFWHNQAGNLDAAITASEAALALNPSSTTALSLLGTLHEKKGNDAEAIRHLQSVLDLNPDSAADAAKLDQLQRGVHVRAVAPPISHQWLPPALLKFAANTRQRGGTLAVKTVTLPGFATLSRLDPQQRPLYAAGAATAVVLVFGLLLAHPWAQAESVKTYPITHGPVAPPATAIDRSAFADPSSPAPSGFGYVKPVIMLPSPSTTPANNSYSPLPLLSAHDPFAGRVPTASYPASSYPSSSAWSLPAVSSRSTSRRSAARDLPPLRLSALPSVDGGGLAPAPITLPEGLGGITATAASVPQHTVMVGSLSGSTANNNSLNGSLADAPSHIHITVRQVSDSSPAASASPDGGTVTIGAGTGDADQQRALSLQQGGSYKEARAVYQNAIRAYQAQIAAGQNVETAQRGLAACQTGLQICQQSQ